MNSRDRRRERRRELQEEYGRKRIAEKTALVEEVLKEHRRILAAMERVRVVAGQLNQRIAAGEAAMHVGPEEFVVDLDEINNEGRIFVEEELRTLKEA